jgi:2-dehydropantoate 2-reductase
MKIGVVGCGALGSFYGAKLCASGANVHFLARSDYEMVRTNGVRIRSFQGDFAVRPRCARDPASIGQCDLIIIGLKTTANDQFNLLIRPLISPRATLLTLQNGLGNEEQLAELFGAEKVMGGLCFVCLNRLEPGVVQHLAHGNVVLGEFQGRSNQRTRAVAELFRHAQVDCELTDDLGKVRWEKLVWNIPFNGLGVAGAAGIEAVLRGHVREGAALGSCLTTDRLLADPQWRQLVRQLMTEVIASAGALGFSIPESIIEDRLQKTRNMGAYKASTLIDFERGQPLEVDSLFLEPLRRAQAAGIETPRLAALCQVLVQLNSRLP